MSDRPRIVLGLGVFLALAAYPVWSALAASRDAGPPDLEPARDPSGCVEDSLTMAADHQEVLNEWRTSVVRDGLRYHTRADGRRFEMSLTGTCLGCHGNAEGFCDRCHEYAQVEPTCWNCHVATAREPHDG